LAGILLLCGSFSVFAQQPTFRTGTRTVALYATVTDAQKRLVPDLTQDSFEIFDNEKPQNMDLFLNEVQPITVVVMLDTSASMTGNLKLLEQVMASIKAFVKDAAQSDDVTVLVLRYRGSDLSG
jgi:Mg-chelatase subunit ChlD